MVNTNCKSILKKLRILTIDGQLNRCNYLTIYINIERIYIRNKIIRQQKTTNVWPYNRENTNSSSQIFGGEKKIAKKGSIINNSIIESLKGTL